VNIRIALAKILCLVNRLLSFGGLSILTRTETAGIYGRPVSAAGIGEIEHPERSDPRLKSLEDSYSFFKKTIGPDTQWNNRVARQISLTMFREDNPFIWQTREKNTAAGYGLSYYYLKTIDHLGLLNKLSEDGAFGAAVYSVDNRLISRDLLDSVAEIHFLDSVLGPVGRAYKTVLDVGAGYGRLAHRFTQAFQNIQIICTDAIALSTFICEYYLRFRKCGEQAQVVPLNMITDSAAAAKPDLAINVHSWSECSVAWVRWWLDLLKVTRVRYLMIVPNGPDLVCRESPNSTPCYEHELSDRGYCLLAKRPKYESSFVQHYGVSPATYYLFELKE